MAALPSAVQISADVLSRKERADDIARLKSMMELHALEYIDVSAHMELLQAFERWPLLAYLEAHHNTPLDLQKDAEQTP